MPLTQSPASLALALCAAITLGACGENKPVDSSPVISESSDLTMTASDYQAFLAGRNNEELDYIIKNREAALDRALDIHSDLVLAQQAEAMGIDDIPSIAARLGDARRQILIAALMEQVRKDVTTPDLAALAKEQYLATKDRHVTKEQRQVAHILLRHRPDCECAEVSTPLEQAQSLRADLQAGADFAELAREHSEDRGTAELGGTLPQWIQRDGDTVKAFEEAVFELKNVGDVSEPVETRFGIHLVKLLDIDPARQLEFDEVKGKIVDTLKSKIVASELEKTRSAAYPDPTTLDADALRQIARSIRDQE